MSDNEDMTEEEMQTYEEAMRMNEQLKMMMMQQQEAEPEQDMRGMMQEMRGQGGRSERAQRQQTQRPNQGGGGRARQNKSGKNYTFDEQKLMGMANENQVLLTKISKIAVSAGTGLSAAPSTFRKNNTNRSSNSINRRRADNKVANENMAFLKRLQNVKPTISKSKHAAAHKQTRTYAKNIRQVKVRTARPLPEWQD
jgi:hypothetical protein